MATFNIVLDKRNKLKDDKFNLAVRMVNGSDVMYINVSKMTEGHYDRIFNNKVKDKETREFLDTCNGYISKCEKIFPGLKPFNKSRFRELFWESDEVKSKSLILTDLFEDYIVNKETIKPTTIDTLRYTKRRFDEFKPGVSVGDITVSFLRKFEKHLIDGNNSQATIDHHMRNLRTIINYFTKVEKRIPNEYEYPFGTGRFSISSFFPAKQVLQQNEIESIVNLNQFESTEHEYARNLWVFLYRMNGANFADLLRLKWNQIDGNYIFFTRKKTESTRKNNKKKIIVPITDKLKDSIEKVADKTSPFILGLLKEGYNEQFFRNRNHKVKQQINRKLKDIEVKLNLSRPLKLSCARDCYATSLDRNNVPREKISSMLGHSNTIITEHYLDSLNPDDTFGINESIL